MNRPTPWAKP